ncbi:MAG: GNAT family N-acetyltransferase [Nitrosopumilaceae archaeon]|nr:GNAT family N-acetyltransferase [Nitrosopumilaceae archaeon]
MQVRLDKLRNIFAFQTKQLKIRRAKNKDKQQILPFCTHTFSWGDYIDRVWDKWIAEKNLLTLEEKEKAVGICNVGISPNQIWIEGIRINPKYRRKGYASKLIIAAEKIAKRKKLHYSRMIIANNNKRSLSMAKKLGYRIEDKWWMYNLSPKRQKTSAKLATSAQNLQSLIKSDTYCESWNWLILDKKALSKLIKAGRVIVYSKNSKPQAMGIWNKTSRLDDDVMQLGYLSGTKTGIKEIVQFMQNKGFEEKSDRIQLLVQDAIKLSITGLDRRMLFCLVKKEIRFN